MNVLGQCMITSILGQNIHNIYAHICKLGSKRCVTLTLLQLWHVLINLRQARMLGSVYISVKQLTWITKLRNVGGHRTPHFPIFSNHLEKKVCRGISFVLCSLFCVFLQLDFHFMIVVEMISDFEIVAYCRCEHTMHDFVCSFDFNDPAFEAFAYKITERKMVRIPIPCMIYILICGWNHSFLDCCGEGNTD